MALERLIALLFTCRFGCGLYLRFNDRSLGLIDRGPIGVNGVIEGINCSLDQTFAGLLTLARH